jgi:hypothetical protein
MTELAFPLYELDDHQDLKRRGRSFWRGGKLRTGTRIALQGVQDTPNVSVMLRSIRDQVNTDHSILTEPVEESIESDSMGVEHPPEGFLRTIGTVALNLSEAR